jgi:signal transduction histidine kinase
LFETLSDLCVVLAPDLTIVAASDGYLQATATQRSAIVGRKVWSVFPDTTEKVGANGSGSLSASVGRVVSTRRPDTMPVQKYRLPLRDSECGGFEERYWRPLNTPVAGPDGSVQWIIHRIEDVTEFVRLKQTYSDREKLAEELRDHAERMETEAFRRAHEVAQANRQLQKANKELAELYEKKEELDRLKSGFFANISDEFRTPLNLILGPVEDARAQEHGSLQGEGLRAVYVNAMRLLKLVNSLLDFARVEQGHIELVLEPTNFSQLTTTLVESFRTRVEQAGLELIVDCPPLPDVVHVDQTVWEKIVLNLVSNAFRTTFEGSIAVSIEWQCDQVVVLFRDTGVGIAESELPRIFEPFYRIPGARSRTHEGTSIGLALVQELVRHHGGTIEVWSEEGTGTTFQVTLPTRRRTPASKPWLTSDHRVPPAYVDPSNLDFETALTASHSPSSPFPQGHILIVDDNAHTRGYLHRLLSPSFRVSVAEDGSAALSVVRKEQPDLILSDVRIPVLDGPGLMRSLREDPQTATIPVILLSSRAEDDGIGTCADTGADDYLVGPFSAGKLLARVRIQLQLSKVRRAAADAARELAKSRVALLAKLEAQKKQLESFSSPTSNDAELSFERISGLVEVLERQFGTPLDPAGKRHLSVIASAAREMDDLVNNLASFCRLSQAEMRKTSVNLRTLVQEVVGQLDEPESDPPTQWILGDLPCVPGDEEMLRLALSNLISNSLKFSSQLSSRRRIEIGAEYSKDGSVVLHVRDNGMGFNMDQADKLFGVFQRLHSHEHFEGLGIGLAIVDRIIQKHGGQVWATGTEGEGAAFYCSLPLQD